MLSSTGRFLLGGLSEQGHSLFNGLSEIGEYAPSDVVLSMVCNIVLESSLFVPHPGIVAISDMVLSGSQTQTQGRLFIIAANYSQLTVTETTKRFTMTEV